MIYRLLEISKDAKRVYYDVKRVENAVDCSIKTGFYGFAGVKNHGFFDQSESVY